jgi:two-component system, OmpR family, sensor kinase
MKPRRLRRAKLRTRVLVAVLAVTLVALAAFDFAAVTALRGYLLNQTDAQLQTVVNPILGPRLRALVQQVQTAKRPRRPRLPIGGQYYVAFVPGRGRAVIFEKPGFVPQIPAGLPGQPTAQPAHITRSGRGYKAVTSWDIATGGRAYAQTVTSDRGHAQLRLLAVPANGGALVAGASISQVNKTLGRLQLIVIAGSLAAGLLVALGVAWAVRRGLRPIETMAAQADRISAGDLTDRVSPQDPGTEVGRLGTALNGMLTRIEASIEEREASQELTRRFFADASHELRNPLASLRANAELYQQGALSHRPQVDEAMRRIALEAQRMSGLVDDMLRLARLDQRPGQHNDPVDLTALITECAERAQIAEPGRTWHTHVAAGLVTAGDEELLRRAIDNLLGNVRAHTPDDAVATITAAARGSSVIVDVSDDGPGVPASQLSRIFDRFYRAGAQSHRPGSGLGLAIVTAIAAAHDGTAEATLNHPHGLRIALTLPASSQPGPASGQPGPASSQARPGSGQPLTVT